MYELSINRSHSNSCSRNLTHKISNLRCSNDKVTDIKYTFPISAFVACNVIASHRLTDLRMICCSIHNEKNENQQMNRILNKACKLLELI